MDKEFGEIAETFGKTAEKACRIGFKFWFIGVVVEILGIMAVIAFLALVYKAYVVA